MCENVNILFDSIIRIAYFTLVAVVVAVVVVVVGAAVVGAHLSLDSSDSLLRSNSLSVSES